jgi:hypothetical protein
MTMFTTKTLSAAVAIIATVSLNGHAAPRQDNPLHPAYYAERSSAPSGVSGGRPYVDSSNPLHPAFAKIAVSGEWTSTRAVNDVSYVDSRNPRHPSFSRAH